MSEIINNREYRSQVLKELIMELHNGKNPDEVKARFEKLIEGISPSEISDMEQSLIMEGMPVQEVQRLCDVHAAIFKGSIEEIHHPEETPGHPVHTLKLENDAIEGLIKEQINPHIDQFRQNDTKGNLDILIADINLLWDIDKHYLRKENLIFPYLEKYGITAPPKVMWGVDDEIREEIKEMKGMLLSYDGNKDNICERFNTVLNKVNEMIFKENSILFPMALDTLTQDEWINIYNESDEIGYSIVEPKGKWKPPINDEKIRTEEKTSINDDKIRFETGILTSGEIDYMLNTMPFDITFIDKDDVVKYFSNGKERIFPRTKSVIGRTVQNCHPPASVHIVEKMLEDFKAGKKDHEDFWIKMGGQYIFIRYFAVRNENGEYIGTMEVSQNIKPIQEINGEKRLVAD